MTIPKTTMLVRFLDRVLSGNQPILGYAFWAPVLAAHLFFPLLVQAGASTPPDGLLPKAEIGALEFLEKHPTYDGRGITIAVLDSGIDPGAPGLQTTTDGKPKIVDLIDASGSGDVDTSTVVEAVDGQFTGLSGRVLRPDPKWRNPSGKFHIGLKAAYDFYPAQLIMRLRERNREHWEEQQRPLQARLGQALAEWKTNHPAPSENEEHEREDLDKRIEELNAQDRAFEDPGPVFDCVVFHDGDQWRAAVDTDGDGKFSNETALTNYRLEHRYATFGTEDLLNFSVNIYQDGNLLSLVTVSGPHGTHVAGITARYLPEQPDLNGIAPGAQLVGIKINRDLIRGGNMEDSSSIVRALAAVRELKCDLMNTSFGELTAWPNHGRLIDLFSELVYEDRVGWIAAVHNFGPALSTLGAPGGTSSAAIGVAAYVSPAMMQRENAMAAVTPEALFAFSSRGPTTDGAWGVSVSAPGSALSAVPNWILARHQAMGGTSMASPSACGAAALILSGLKTERLIWTPWSLRRAFENTARQIPGAEVFGQGQGLVQVGPAFELSRRLSAAGSVGPRLEVKVWKTIFSPSEQRGIYLREPEEAAQRRHFWVLVETVFPKAADNRERLSFERRYRLQSTVPWIQPATFLFVNGRGSRFEVIVDPTHLESGAHAAEVLGFEEGQEDLGPAFRVPVTVIRPIRLEPTNHLNWVAEFPLKPGNIERRFFDVPPDASWAELKIRSKGVANDRPIGASGVQLPAGARPDLVLEQWFPIRDGKEQVSRFHLTGGRTLEIVLGNAAIEVSGDPWFSLGLEFHGLRPSVPEVFFDGAARVLRVDVQAMTRPAELEPKAVLHTWRRSIPPTDADCHPLPTERDKLTEGRRLYELILSYTFNLDESASVTPRFPALYGRLYDGEFESQVRMWFDSNKRLLRVEENYHDAEPLRLGKGQHTLRLQLRYDRPDSLENLKSLPLLLDQDLDTRLTLAVCRNPDDALTGHANFERYALSPDESAVFYLAAPSGQQVAKAGKPGDLLIGTIRYEPEPSPVSYPLTFLVPPPEAKTSAKNPRKSPETKPLPEQLADARRDFEIAQLAKLNSPTNASLFNEQYFQLQSKYPGHLPLFAERLHCLDAEAREQHLRSVVAAADEVIQHIDTNRLAGYFGLRSSPEDATTRKAREEMEHQRDALVDALHRKATALADMERPEKSPATNALSSACEPPFDKAEIDRLFEETFSSLRRWVDTRDDEYVAVHRQWDRRHGRLGEALKLLHGQIEKKPTDRDLFEQQIRLLKELGWEHCATNQERWLLRRFRKTYPRF